MADLRPFCGIRYARDVKLDDVVAPPYDVLDAAQAGGLRGRSPFNAVHVDLPVGPGETAADDAYERAARTFHAWLDDGVLVRDERPAIYLIDQVYRGPDGVRRTRRGVVARLLLAGLDERVVLPHEQTHAGPKVDRLRLYRAAHADLSQIFLLYPDDDGAVRATLEAVPGTEGGVDPRETRDDDGNVHRLQPVTGEAAVHIASALSGRRLYIADGHHRYETALAYRDERRAAGDHSADTMMVYLCGMDDPGLAVFPTHRLVKGFEPPPAAEVLRRLASSFEVADPRPLDETDGPALVDGLRGHLPAFGLVFPREGVWSVIRLRSAGVCHELHARGLPRVTACLPVTLLQQLVLGDAVGLPPDATEGRLDYVTDPGRAFSRLCEGEYTFGAFLPPTSVADVRAVADAGETMPQKSTYFYPKLLTGLVYDQLGG